SSYVSLVHSLFFFNLTAPSVISSLSLHDALPISEFLLESVLVFAPDYRAARYEYASVLVQRHKYLQAIEETNKLLQLEPQELVRSEEHTSELQSQSNLVCRLLLEKKKKKTNE